LETLAEIDTEILQTTNSSELLEMVCRRAIDLLKASKACIAMIKDNKSNILALYGFQDNDKVIDEFTNDKHLDYFDRKQSYAVRNLSKKNFRLLMPRTRERENIRSLIAEKFIVESDLQAILIVFDEKPREWLRDDHQLLKFVTRQIAIAIEKTNLLNNTEQRAKNFETLYSLIIICERFSHPHKNDIRRLLL